MAVIVEKRNLCGLVIDAVVEESHSVSSRVTEHPVSVGSPISDHVYRGPLTLTIRGIIGATPPKNYIQGDYQPRNLANSPLSKQTESLLGGDTNLTVGGNNIPVDAVNNQVNTTGITHFGTSTTSIDYDTPASRIQAAWCRLIELQDNKEVCQVVSGLKVYDEMVVESVSTTQNSENCDKLDFTVTLKEIKRVRTQETTIVSINTASKGSKDRGKQAPDCLTLSQVFTPQAQQADASFSSVPFPFNSVPFIANQDPSVQISVNGSIERDGAAGVFSPFTSETYDSFICGELRERWVGTRKVNQQTQPSTSSFGPTTGVYLRPSTSPSVIQQELTSNGSPEPLAAFATSACEVLLRSPSCEFANACNETRFTGSIEDSSAQDLDEDSILNVEVSSSPTVAEANSRRRAEQDIIDSDPANQLYARQLRFLSGVDESLQRLNCYQRVVVDALGELEFGFNGEDLDLNEFLKLVGSGQVPPSFPDFNQIPKPPPPLIVR